MNNPFSISFGKKPTEYISRIQQTEEILGTFTDDSPSSQAYMIVGVRGSGKTVILSTISNELKDRNDWIVFELNPTRDMLNSFAAKLYALPIMHEHFVEAKLDLSLLGIGVSVAKGNKYSDVEQAISAMLDIVQKKKKRILITVDEVINSQYMKEFVSGFQIFIRNDYPVFLLMTGLYNNINNLQNDKSLTFLYRTPKIKLESLNRIAIAESYKNIFGILPDNAKILSDYTKGYSFAFQALGYVICKNISKMSDNNFDKCLNDVLPVYDQILQEYSYEKIWSELSAKEKEILMYLAKDENATVGDIRKALKMESNKFSVYSKRIRDKGILSSDGYGLLSFSLPRFGEFVRNLYY